MRTTEFKDTELGPIPKDWEVKRLGEMLTIGNGRDYKHLGTGDVPVYGTGGLMTYVDDFLFCHIGLSSYCFIFDLILFVFSFVSGNMESEILFFR